MNTKLRATAAAVVAAVAIGVAAPTASAVTHEAPVRSAVAVQTVQTSSTAEARALTASLTQSGISAQANGSAVTVKAEAKGGYGRIVYQIAKRIIAKYGKPAVKKIVKNWHSYVAWKNGLSRWNPIRWALWAVSGEIQYDVYEYLRQVVFG
ncbi:hypothetical protein [Streptomyces sp. NPDC001340]